MYKIIGADQQEYGPVGTEDLRQWIREGRANAQSPLLSEGSASWRPLGTFPEFAAALDVVRPPAPAPFSPVPLSGSPAQRTNGMAVAGLVFSLLGVPCCSLGVFSILGLIFSWVGLVQIGANPSQNGKGAAIAGIIISVIALLIGVAIWVAISVNGFSQELNHV